MRAKAEKVYLYRDFAEKVGKLGSWEFIDSLQAARDAGSRVGQRE